MLSPSMHRMVGTRKNVFSAQKIKVPPTEKTLHGLVPYFQACIRFGEGSEARKLGLSWSQQDNEFQ